MREFGLTVPRGTVKVVEDTDDCVHITLPMPPAGYGDLSDDELCDAAGGGVWAFS